MGKDTMYLNELSDSTAPTPREDGKGGLTTISNGHRLKSGDKQLMIQ